MKLWTLPSCLLKNALEASFSISEPLVFSFWRATAMINIWIRQTKKPKQVNFSNTWLAVSQTVRIYTDVDVENEMFKLVACFKVYSIKLFLFTVQTMCRHLFLCLIIMLNTGEQIPTDVQFSKINQSANWWV